MRKLVYMGVNKLFESIYNPVSCKLMDFKPASKTLCQLHADQARAHRTGKVSRGPAPSDGGV